MSYNEEDTKLHLITPALQQAGWIGRFVGSCEGDEVIGPRRSRRDLEHESHERARNSRRGLVPIVVTVGGAGSGVSVEGGEEDAPTVELSPTLSKRSVYYSKR